MKGEPIMTLTTTKEDGKITIALEGKLSVNSSSQLQDALIPAFDEAKEVVLDFTDLIYVSSAGLRVLLVGDETATEKGGSMKLTNVSDDIMEVFDMTGFTSMLDIV